MKKTIIVMLLIMLPLMFAAVPFTGKGPNNSGPGMTQNYNPEDLVMSPDVPQYNTFVVGDIEPMELVKKYCSAVNFRLIILFIIAGLMWLFQPMYMKLIMQKDIDNAWISSTALIYIYKWLGLGLMFIGIYGLFILR